MPRRMPTNARQVEFLARAIVNRLEDRGLVEFVDAEAGIDVVTRALAANLQAVDAIEQEARVRLAARSRGHREPAASELQEEMRKVAAERNILI